MSEIEICVVANGYIVRKSVSAGSYAPLEEMHVFETFASLMDWLRKNLKEPAKQKASK